MKEATKVGETNQRIAEACLRAQQHPSFGYTPEDFRALLDKAVSDYKPARDAYNNALAHFDTCAKEFERLRVFRTRLVEAIAKAEQDLEENKTAFATGLLDHIADWKPDSDTLPPLPTATSPADLDSKRGALEAIEDHERNARDAAKSAARDLASCHSSLLSAFARREQLSILVEIMPALIRVHALETAGKTSDVSAKVRAAVTSAGGQLIREGHGSHPWLFDDTTPVETHPIWPAINRSR